MSDRYASGMRLGSYTLRRLLARGGTSDVYVARRAGDSNDVALKVLVGLTPSDRVRSEREVAVAAALLHPRIARLLDHEAIPPDTVVLAFELLRGETLAQRIARGPLTPAEALAITDQILEGLAVAHSQGVVHRDVKPANVFLCEGDALDVRLLDFGLARTLAGQRVTSTGRLLGTPSYMAPERLRRDGGMDLRGDLWSVGVTLFESLTGALPFDGATSLSAMFQIAFGESRRLDEVWREAPPSLVQFCARALARDPAARFANAEEFRAALREAGSSAAARAPAESPSGGTVENRLITIVVARARGDARFLLPLLDATGARVAALDDGVAAVFGQTCWTGDEPHRATQLARALERLTTSVAVVTDHAVLRGEALPAELVARAVSLLPAKGIALDPATATLVRDDPAVPGRAAAVVAPEWRSAFVGRTLERDLLLDAALGAQRAGLPTGVLILGPRGMGRSRLLDEALTALAVAAPDALPLRARCVPTRREVSFAALQDALGDHVHPGLAAVLQSASQGDPQAAFDRVRADLDVLLARLSEAAPVVLAIDDAQWLDPASRGVLRSILDASAMPISLWCFADPEARAALHGLVPGTTTRALAPLSPDDALRLVRGLRPHSAVEVEAIVARAGGSPLVLEALASQPEGAPLPLDVESAMRAGLDRLDAAERDFILRASIFGGSAPLEGVRALGGGDCLGALRRGGWVTLRSRSRYAGSVEFEFRSEVVAEVARGVWPDDQRRRLHADAARWLVRRDDAIPEEVAAQWDLAGDAESAALAWTEATVHASRRGAMEAAAAHCLRVLERTALTALRWKALASRDDALQMSGDRALQRAGLDAMAALAPRLAAGARAEVAWRYIHHARMVGDEALAEVHRAAIEAFHEREEVTRWICAAAMELALLYADRGRLREAHVQADRAVALAGPLGSHWQRARAAHALAYVLVEEGTRLDQALTHYAAAAADYERAGDLRREAITHVNRGAALAALGRLGESLDSLDLAIQRARAVGNHRATAVALENRGAVRRMIGDREQARADLGDALARARQLGHRALVEVASVELLYVALGGGTDDDELRRLAEGVRPSLDGDLGPTHLAAGTAVVIRALGRLGATDEPLVARARRLVDDPGLPLSSRAELRVALWEVDDRREADAVAFAALLGAIVVDALDAEDATIRARAVYRRFETPPALAAWVEARR